MRILVTGGAGFIGSNLVWALLTGGHDVFVIDDLSTGVPENLHPAAGFRTLDILDPAMPAVMAEFGPDAVVHLAAQASVSVSFDDPERDRAVNAEGTRLVARAAADAGATRVLSASSAAVYGEPAVVPLLETSPKTPVNPYGASKLEAESLLAAELRPRGVDFASLRFANVYGPRQNAEGEGGVIAIWSAALAEDRSPVIFGTGKQTRDFIYVGDIVGAIVAQLLFDGTLAAEGDDGPAYNISTGVETSLEALVLGLRAAAGWMGSVEYAAAREGDVDRSALSPAKARDTFGWDAHADLQTGLAQTWQWYSAHGG